MSKTKTYEPLPGEDISETAKVICTAAKREGLPVVAEFSGITLTANPGDTPESIEEAFLAQIMKGTSMKITKQITKTIHINPNDPRTCGDGCEHYDGYGACELSRIPDKENEGRFKGEHLASAYFTEEGRSRNFRTIPCMLDFGLDGGERPEKETCDFLPKARAAAREGKIRYSELQTIINDMLYGLPVSYAVRKKVLSNSGEDRHAEAEPNEITEEE